MFLVRILAYIQQHSDPAAAAATIKQFCHRTVNEDAELAHKLLGEEFSSQISTLREMTANVINGEYIQEVSLFSSFTFSPIYRISTFLIHEKHCIFVRKTKFFKLISSSRDCIHNYYAPSDNLLRRHTVISKLIIINNDRVISFYIINYISSVNLIIRK